MQPQNDVKCDAFKGQSWAALLTGATDTPLEVSPDIREAISVVLNSQDKHVK